MDGAAHVPDFSRPELLRYDDSCTKADTVDEAYEQKNEVACSAYGGKRSVAEQIAHNERVGGVVELLEEISQNQGNSKGDDGLPDASPGHAV